MLLDENPKKKKKKTRKPRKQQAKKTLMTLAFDSNKTKIASVVKKKLNVQSAKKITRPPGRKLQLLGTQLKNNTKLVQKPIENKPPPSIVVDPSTPGTSKIIPRVRNKVMSNLHHYFTLHVCLSFCPFVTLHCFFMFIAQGA